MAVYCAVCFTGQEFSEKAQKELSTNHHPLIGHSHAQIHAHEKRPIQSDLIIRLNLI